MFKKNLGRTDRIIRFVLGCIGLVFSFVTGIWWIGLIAISIFGTGFIGWCGTYAIFGLSSCKLKEVKTEIKQ